MLKMSIADAKRIASILNRADEIEHPIDLGILSLENLAPKILESEDEEAIDAYNLLKAFLEKEKEKVTSEPELEVEGSTYFDFPVFGGGAMSKLGLVDPEALSGKSFNAVVTNPISDFNGERVLVTGYRKGKNKFRCVLLDNNGMIAWFSPSSITPTEEGRDMSPDELEVEAGEEGGEEVINKKFVEHIGHVLVGNNYDWYMVGKFAGNYNINDLHKTYSQDEIDYYIDSSIWKKASAKVGKQIYAKIKDAELVPRGLGRGLGAGPGGECVCPNCGKAIPHKTGTPCFHERCPKCNTLMIRRDLEDSTPAE